MLTADLVAKRFRSLARSVGEGDTDSVSALGALTQEVVADGDLAAVTRLRLLFERFATTVDDPALAGRLAGLDDVLASRERHLVVAHDATRREARRDGVRERVLQTVREAPGPIQPSAIAQRCGIRLHQASRALAELVEREEITRVPAPASESDQRTRWYQPVSTLAAR